MVQTSLKTKPPGAHGDRVSKTTLALGMLHVSALVLGHVLGNKSAELGPFIVTLTVLSFPLVFLTTDLLNEHYGRAMASRVTLLSLGCVAMAFVLIEIARRIPSATETHLPTGAFEHVFGIPASHIAALLAGYGFGQFADIQVFYRLRNLTHGRRLWLRILGSTAVGEALDGLVVSAFLSVAPTVIIGYSPRAVLLEVTWNQALVRMAIVLALLPLVYLVHRVVAHGADPGRPT